MKFSVIIPCRNEEKYIAKCLHSICATSFNKENLIVFVCDGLSTDNTQRIINEYVQKYAWIKLLINENKTTPFAFNLGIENSLDADVFVTIGAHAEIEPDFFEQIISAFKIDSSIGCVGGVLKNVYENETSMAIGLAMSSSFGVGNAYFRTGTHEGFVDTVSFPAYKKEVFEKVGNFNTTLARNQDDEFNYRVVKAGYKIFLSKGIKSNYFVRASFNKLFKQYFQYGYWKVYVNQLHKTVTTIRQLVPPAFVGFLVLGVIFSLFIPYAVYVYAGILICYLMSAVFFAARTSNSISSLFKTAFAFMILHIGYGLGYWKGMINFYLLRKKPSKKAEVLTR